MIAHHAQAVPASFQKELALIRQRLVLEHKDDPLLPLELKVLDDWAKHPDAGKPWKILTDNLPLKAIPTAEQFICLVLARRVDVAERLSKMVREIPELDDEIEARIKLHRKNKRYELVSDEMERQDNFHSEADRVLGRKKSIAPRQKFMVGWSEKFKELCGQPLDEAVRILTEVAFDDEATLDEVRWAQKQRTIAKKDQ
jgi:hypothetical protein